MKKIIIGVTGSIAAYKSLSLVRLLVKLGKEVKVIMTPAATAFVAPLSFATLSKKSVIVDIIDGDQWSNHVELGLWADAFVVAPSTATTIAKMASGQSDSMLVATYLSARCPVFVAPAMDIDMWKHPATQANVARLISHGNHMIPVGHGELASGLIGEGRMAEPEEIVSFLDRYAKKKEDLKGSNVLITGGPTRETIDPVRFIGNLSTGRMGIALAEECASRGARVWLVLGPTSIQPQNPDIQVINVQSAEEMFSACQDRFYQSNIVIFAAAVADYTPAQVSEQKMNKSESGINLSLKRTKDIAATLGQSKKPYQVICGFALETENEDTNARRKLDKKNFDLIVLNSLQHSGAGFGHDTNQVTIYQHHTDPITFPLKNKRAVAQDIIDTLKPILAKKEPYVT